MIDALIAALQVAKRRRSAEKPVGARYAALCDLLADEDAFAPEVDGLSSSCAVDEPGAGAIVRTVARPGRSEMRRAA